MPHIGWRGAFILTACGPLAGTVISFWALRAVWRNKPAMLLIWAYVFHSWELLGMWAWLPAYLAVSITHGAMPTALTYITTMGSIYGGAFSERWGRTKVIMWGACLSLLCSCLPSAG